MAPPSRPSLRDRVRQRAEEQRHTGGSSYIKLPPDVKFLQTHKGKMELDILPYEVACDTNPEAEKGTLWYQRTFYLHRDIGAEQKPYICPSTIGKKCPICEHRAILARDPNADEATLKSLKKSERELFNVIDLETPATEKEGVKVFESSVHTFGKKLNEELREGDEDWVGFADLEKGYTLKVRFTEETLGKNKFLDASRIDFEPRDDYPESILDEVVDLDACLVILPYDKLEKIFLDLGDENHDAPAGDPAPERERPTRESRSRSNAPADPPPAEERQSRSNRHEPEREPVQQTSSRRSRDPEPEREVPADPPPTTATRTRERPAPPPVSDGPACPSGGTWAASCDKLDACFTCPLWDACRDAADLLESAAKGK